ncbi:MAG: hypothetical protein QGI21_02215 [Candidatus Poseidoniaceae archaeon]|jgi:hypothetical protein|nr:hypothetical protein [Candidatus Poseidoniaceae archaeon]
MNSRTAMYAFGMFSILLMSNMGCIGLVPAREIIEGMREEPKLEELEFKVNINHTFVDIQLTPFVIQETFEVDSRVTEIKAFMQASLRVGDFGGGTEDFNYVEATLSDSNGTTIWSQRLTESGAQKVPTFTPPFADGTWTLRIESRGYGEELLGLQKDSFQVIITVTKECWKYPQEEVCSFD